MKLQLLLCAASLSFFDLVNARPQAPASRKCVIQEAGRLYNGECTNLKGSPHKVLLNSESCDISNGERCLVNAMPCSGQYNFFCGNEDVGCFAAPNLQRYPDYTGKKLGKNQGICPQDLTCCRGCSEEECDPKLFPASLSYQPVIEPLGIAGLPSSSPKEFQIYDIAFNLADSTVPMVPNAGTLPPTHIDTNSEQPSTGAADLLRIPNSQEQNTDLNYGLTTSDFFKPAPIDLNQRITLPVEHPPLEIQELRPALEQQDPALYQVPLDR